MNIIIVGKGKMSEEVIKLCNENKINVVGFKNSENIKNIKDAVAIHFGSGREFPDLVSFCENKKIPIIQGSTNIDIRDFKNRNVLIINSPNLSIPMMTFMENFPVFIKPLKKQMNLKVLESHQKEKVDVSGTARKILKEIKEDESIIKPIRDEKTQIRLGIPKKHLKGHAYHEFKLEKEGVEIKISAKVLGRKTYAEGALFLAKKILNNKIKNGIYELSDLIKNNKNLLQ
jgi:dihydrodipicolinate reductase